ISDCYIDMTFNQTVIPGVDDGEGNITGGDDSVERIAGVNGYSEWNSKITVKGCTINVSFNNVKGNRLAGIMSDMNGENALLTINNNNVTIVVNGCNASRVGGLVGTAQVEFTASGNNVSAYYIDNSNESNQGGLIGLIEGDNA